MSRWIAIALLGVSLLVGAERGVGQSLLAQYQEARLAVMLEEALETFSPILEPLPLERAVVERDDVLKFITAHQPHIEPEVEAIIEPEAPFKVYDWQRINPLQRRWFEQVFRTADWISEKPYLRTPLDTIATTQLRGKLQHLFGSPTIDAETQASERNLNLVSSVQFAYWFLVNGHIPLIIYDVNGPFGKGLMIQTDYDVRERLPIIKQAMADLLHETAVEASYADYYFVFEEKAWYKIAGDGTIITTEVVAAPPFVSTGNR